MKKITFPFLLLLLSMKATAQCPDSFPLPYMMNTENVETPGLPDCMSSMYFTFASDEIFESIAGPVEGFNGQVLAYDSTAEESNVPLFVGASLNSWQIALEEGVDYRMSCMFGVSEGNGTFDSFSISLGMPGSGQSIAIISYLDIPAGTVDDYESAVFTVPESGNYSLSFNVDSAANQGFFYVDDIALYEDGMMGINDNLLAGVTAYVDAATSKLIINADREVDSVELYTMAGQKVYSESVIAQTHEAEIGHLAQGIYILNIGSGESKKYMKIYRP